MKSNIESTIPPKIMKKKNMAAQGMREFNPKAHLY
jgi:hypothetical protein